MIENPYQSPQFSGVEVSDKVALWEFFFLLSIFPFLLVIFVFLLSPIEAVHGWRQGTYSAHYVFVALLKTVWHYTLIAFEICVLRYFLG